jgi:hypothetical protein
MASNRREIRVHQAAATHPRKVKEPAQDMRHEEIPESMLVEATDKNGLLGRRDHFIDLGKRSNPIETRRVMSATLHASHPAPQGPL